MKKTTSESRTLEHYLGLSYPYALVREEDGTFFASHPDLLGCMAQGVTADEAVQALDTARRVWIEARFEENLPIPEPVDQESFSGKILLRIPPALHAELARISRQQDVSLNLLINNILSEHVGGARVLNALSEQGGKTSRVESKGLSAAFRATSRARR